MRSYAAIVALSALVVLAVAGVGTPALAAAVGGPSSAAAADERPATTAPQVETSEANGSDVPAGTTIEVQLLADGDARWTVTSEFDLRTESEIRAFQRLGEEFRRGTTDPGYSVDIFEHAADDASTATGRQMTVQNDSRSWELEKQETETNATNATGHLTLTFTWTNFAQASENRVVLGDVFGADERSWLPGLSERQSLIVRAPPGYYVDSASTGPENASLHWEGPTQFGEEELDATFTRTGSPVWSWPAGLAEAGLVALFLVGLLGAYGIARRSGAPLNGWLSATDDEDDSSSASGHAPDPSERVVAADGETDDEADPTEPFEDVDEELLSDEERVERLLEANGGRMKQGTIVKETGWSNAKVSQLLSSMADEGNVDKLRIGRENLITLPDEDVGDIE